VEELLDALLVVGALAVTVGVSLYLGKIDRMTYA
jgi:hypothetical protein